MQLPWRRTPDVKIRIGRPYEVVQDERRIATAAFADELRRDDGLRVKVEEIEYVPGRRGLTPVEWTLIFIGVTKALDVTVDAVAARAKKMLQRRREAKKAAGGGVGRHLGYIIYGPDGEELRKWTTKEDGEGKPDGG